VLFNNSILHLVSISKTQIVILNRITCFQKNRKDPFTIKSNILTKLTISFLKFLQVTPFLLLIQVKATISNNREILKCLLYCYALWQTKSPNILFNKTQCLTSHCIHLQRVILINLLDKVKLSHSRDKKNLLLGSLTLENYVMTKKGYFLKQLEKLEKRTFCELLRG